MALKHWSESSREPAGRLGAEAHGARGEVGFSASRRDLTALPTPHNPEAVLGIVFSLFNETLQSLLLAFSFPSLFLVPY